MASKRIVAPDTPIRSFPTPNIDDLVVILDVDSRLPGYKPLDYGTLHPDQTRFPGAKLVYQEPLDNSDQFVRRIYTTDRADQDAYNYAIKYSAGSPKHPIYIRTYVELRESYSPLADGTPDPLFPDAFLVEEEMAQVEGELNSLYVKVSRVFETLPGPVLTGFETNEAGQKVTVTTQRKSSNNYTLPSASATSSPSAQAEDTGVVTEQIRTVPSIFTRKQFSAERPDMLPQKFRAAVPDVETSELVLGTAEQPTLLQGDISASQTQQSLFVKQIARRSRTAPTYPVTIVETTATRSGQLATVTSTLDDSIQTADTGPLIESSEVTDLGDGRSIKVTTEVDEVFEQPSFTRSREDMTPQKFRAAITETVEERTVGGTAEMPQQLTGNELSRTEEQVTLDRKRTRVQERSVPTTPTLLGQVYTSDLGGGTAVVTETYGQNVTIQPGYGTVSAEKEALGDGNFVTRHVTLTDPQELEGQLYDDQLDVVFPFTQKVVSASASGLGEERIEIEPKDVLHSVRREVDIEEFRSKAFLEHWIVPAYIDVNLPDILESVTVVYARSVSSGAATGTGASWTIQASGSTSMSGDARIVIRNGYTGPVPATRHVFFVDKANATNAVILQKTNSQNWPAVFTRPEILTIAGGTVTFTRNQSFSIATENYAGSASSSSNYTGEARVGIVTIQPTLHGNITVVRATDVEISSLSAGGGTITASAPALTPAFSPATLPATNPSSFPTGDFLVNVTTESYKYGLVRVSATVAHITSQYV